MKLVVSVDLPEWLSMEHGTVVALQKEIEPAVHTAVKDWLLNRQDIRVTTAIYTQPTERGKDE